MSDEKPAPIRVQGLGKRYRRMTAGAHLRTLKSALMDGSLLGGLREEETIEALKEINFEVGRGEAFGVIGGNGSGKSTLLKIVAGILQPTTGQVVVDGRVAALIELGAGFHPEISGRENVFINGTLLGLTRAEIEAQYASIVAFSGLEAFMEEPVKNYSSGMYVRLGFAVAVHTDPDVLLVDEVLSVGDEAFGHRCVRRMEELLAAGKTMLLVSHSLDLVSRLCDRVLWLEQGEQRLLASPRRTIDAYRQSVADAEGREHQQEQEQEQRDAEEAGTERWGSGAARITAVRLLCGGEEEPDRERYLVVCGDPLTFEIQVETTTPLEDFVFGIAVATPRGVEVWGTNTDLHGLQAVRLEGKATVKIECPELRLGPGEYTVDIAVHARDGAPYDYRRRVVRFTVTAPERGAGVYFPRHRWRFEGGVACRPRPRRSEE